MKKVAQKFDIITLMLYILIKNKKLKKDFK